LSAAKPGGGFTALTGHSRVSLRSTQATGPYTRERAPGIAFTDVKDVKAEKRA